MLLLLSRCPAGGPLRRAAPLGQSRGRLRVLLQRRHRLRARPDACATPPLPRPAFAPAVTRRPLLVFVCRGGCAIAPLPRILAETQ